MSRPTAPLPQYRPAQYRPAWLAAGLLLCLAAQGAAAAPPPGQDWALSIYAGRLSGDDWHQVILPGTADFADAYLATVALAKTVHRAADLPVSYEVEGQLAKHFGDQDNWEINLLAAARWHRFPWNDRVRTTAAFGIGPSYATSMPRFEVASNGTSQQWLAYWHIELTFAPPSEDWSALLRLHHRSTAFGLFGDEGGYNAVTLGVRVPF